MSPDQDLQAPLPDGRLKLLRLLGILLLALVALTLTSAVLAPYAGRIADVLLQHTLHWQWTALVIDRDTVLPRLETPAQAVQSYYSALYQGDSTSMERLTAGDFRAAMRQRLSHGSAAPAFTPYRSYLRTDMQSDREAFVIEKFHLFWQRGLRFRLQRQATGWQIIGLESLPES